MHLKGWGGLGGTQPYTSQFSFLSSVTLWSWGLGNCPELRAGFYIQFYHWMQPSNSQHTDRSDSKAYALGASHPFYRVAAAMKKHTACPDRKFLILFDIFLQCGICIYLQNQFFILQEKKAASLAISEDDNPPKHNLCRQSKKKTKPVYNNHKALQETSYYHCNRKHMPNSARAGKKDRKGRNTTVGPREL